MVGMEGGREEEARTPWADVLRTAFLLTTSMQHANTTVGGATECVSVEERSTDVLLLHNHTTHIGTHAFMTSAQGFSPLPFQKEITRSHL